MSASSTRGLSGLHAPNRLGTAATATIRNRRARRLNVVVSDSRNGAAPRLSGRRFPATALRRGRIAPHRTMSQYPRSAARAARAERSLVLSPREEPLDAIAELLGHARLDITFGAER